MGALIDLTGQSFGLLTVVKRLGNRTTASGARQPVWGCRCQCGRRTVEEGRALRAGRAMSCRECVRDPSRMLKYGHTYLVWWPTLGILKIGRTTRGERLEMMRQTGGLVIFDAQDTDESWERVGLAALRRLFDPAFTGPSGVGPHRADRILFKGRGWSECFFVDEEYLQLAYDVCFRAFMREGNDFGQNPPATPAWRRALTGILRARAAARSGRDRARVADDDGPDTDRAVADPAGSGTPVPAAPAACRGGAAGRARPCDGGSRPRLHLGRRDRPSDRVSHPTRPVDLTQPHRAVTAAHRAPFSPARKRERGNAGARERAGTSARAGGGTHPSGPVGSLGAGLRTACTGQACPPDSAGCSAHGVYGSSVGVSHALRSVWHGDGASSGVLGEGEVHRAAGVVRGDADRRGGAV